MPYLIDGHNLIPRVRGLNLQQLDDEQALIARLEVYFQGQRKQAVVYFDRAQPGGSPDIKRAFLNVHFVRPPAIADTAILRHLRRLKGEARNWVVVSSDNEVRMGAEHLGARVLSSEEFAVLLDGKTQKSVKEPKPGGDDIDFWLKTFQKPS
jgi:predicted RNA-binding protein with PIN domain